MECRAASLGGWCTYNALTQGFNPSPRHFGGIARSSRLATCPTDWRNGQGGELTSGELDERITTWDDHDEWYRLVVPWPQERYRTQGYRQELVDLVSPQWLSAGE